MKVCILAGGMGHRISDDEERIPKPLTEIGDIPIIEHIMNIYDFYGHKEFILCLGYKDYLIKEYFKNYELYNYNMQKNLSTGEEKYWKNFSKQKDWLVNCISTGLKTATGSRVKKIRNYIDDTFMLTYGDGLANIPAPEACGVDAYLVPQIRRDLVEVLDTLLEELLHVGENDDAAVPATDGVFADRSKNRSLTPCGGNDDAGIVIAFAEMPVNSLDGLFLVLAQLHPTRLTSISQRRIGR